jgi:hypothetical protein
VALALPNANNSILTYLFIAEVSHYHTEINEEKGAVRRGTCISVQRLGVLQNEGRTDSTAPSGFRLPGLSLAKPKSVSLLNLLLQLEDGQLRNVLR